MLEYADYNFYKSIYRGTLDNNLFNSLIPKASREIDSVVNKELKEVNITDKVKFVACEMVDFLNENERVKSSIIVSSKSLDGASESYKIKNSEELKQEKMQILDKLPLDLICFL